MENAILKEIELRKNEFSALPISSIYFGGGTPSLLDVKSIASFIEAIYKNCSLASNVEITLEANPDDLHKEKLLALKQVGVNRLSVGTQSFDQPTLRFLNRAHNAVEAIKSLEMAKNHFSNISVDLIYGIETQVAGVFENDLAQLQQLNCEHISAYCLTIEGNNAFAKWLAQGKMKEVDEDLAIEHFKILTHKLNAIGYQQYEISNFCKPSYESKHNTSYWFGEHYVGLGPSAHSFNGLTRSWNMANNHHYIAAIEKNKLPNQTELLSPQNKANEYIMTRLRTKWGCSLEELKTKHGLNLLEEQVKTIDFYLKEGKVNLKEGIITLTETGKLIADKIASDLFVTHTP